MLPMVASVSAGLVTFPAALPEDEDPEDALPEDALPEDEDPEDALPDDEDAVLEVDEDPDADAVEEVDDAVVSPALSVDVCDAVSQAATKKATAKSAIRRCNMIMLPVFVPARRNVLPTFLNYWRYSTSDFASSVPVSGALTRSKPSA